MTRPEPVTSPVGRRGEVDFRHAACLPGGEENSVRSRWLASRGEVIGEACETAVGVETVATDRKSGPSSATRGSGQGGSTGPSDRRTGYEHLAPLHAKHAALPEGHVDREQLRAELIAGYLPVARNIAHKFGYRGECPDDLEQVASVGLVLAVDRFEPGRGVDFLYFAVPTITGEVLRHFRDRTNTIRVPRRLRALQAMIDYTAAELEQRNGRSARPSEIAERLGVDVEFVIEGLAARGAGRPRSLDEPDLSGDGSSDRARFGSALGLHEAEFDLVEHRQTLAPLLAALPERERRILLLRFFDGLTQTQIAAQVGISQMHVSRLLTRTLAGLRRQLMADGPAVQPAAP
jgi:RNA polymerase sigma-B factor